jgi:hypothetical protein
MLLPTVSPPVCIVFKPHMGLETTRFLLLDSCGFVDVGRLFWREDGSFAIAAGLRQYSHFCVRVPRDSWLNFTASDSRLPQPWGPDPYIYIPQGQGGSIIPPGTWFPFPLLVGLLWRYSNPSQTQNQSRELLYDSRFTAKQFVSAPSSLRLTASDFSSTELLQS